MTVYFVAGILFSVFTSADFFLRRAFFYGGGTTDLTAFFSSVPYVCIIIIPVICLRNSKDLYSAFIPLGAVKKILKRYLRLLCVFAVMTATLLIPCIIVGFCGQVDAGQIFVSLLFLIFYGSAAIALCIFTGSLFSSVPVYLIVSATLLALVNSAHLLPLYASVPSYITELARAVSFAWHFDSASKGLADSRDFVFFASSTCIFLYAAFLREEAVRGRIFSKKAKYSIAVNFLILLMLLFDFGKIYTRLDFSKSKMYSVSKYTKNLSQKLDSPLKITYYRSSSLVKYYPQVRNITDYLESYASENKNISFMIKNPDKDERILKQLENWEIPSQQLRTVTDTSSQFITVYSAIILEYNGLIQAIPFILSSENLEYDLAVRLMQLISRRQRIVNVIIGNGMTLSEDYGYLVPWLNSQGFICNYIDLQNENFSAELEKCRGPLLIIGDSEILVEKAIAIENYLLSEYGNAFFAVSPFSVNIQDDWNVKRNLNTNIVEILENWGVVFKDDLTADLSCSRIQLYTQDETSITGQTDTRFVNYPMWINIPPQENSKNGLTFFWPAAIELGENASAYLHTSGTAFKMPVSRSGEKLIETNPFYVQMSSDKYGSYPAAAFVSGNLNGYFTNGTSSRTKAIVVPDQYFVNSLMTGYNSSDFSDYRGFEFLANALLKLNGEEELARLHDKHNYSTELTKLTDKAAVQKMKNLSYAVVFVICPVIAVLILIILLLKEKNLYKRLYDERFVNENEKK